MACLLLFRSEKSVTAAFRADTNVHTPQAFGTAAFVGAAVAVAVDPLVDLTARKMHRNKGPIPGPTHADPCQERLFAATGAFQVFALDVYDIIWFVGHGTSTLSKDLKNSKKMINRPLPPVNRADKAR